MFSRSADLYDAIYGFRDYAGEAAQIAARVRALLPDARTLLDVGCGTGEHVRLLADVHGFAADGLDMDAGLIAVARRKHPAGGFIVADMSRFAIRRSYDVAMSLFSSIGYLVTLDRVERAMACVRDHVRVDGVFIVEPWFAPGVLQPGREFRQSASSGDVQVDRIGRCEVDGRISRLHFDYDIRGPGGDQRLSEVHELGLFTEAEMRAAFEAAGWQADLDSQGLTGRGLWIARPAFRRGFERPSGAASEKSAGASVGLVNGKPTPAPGENGQAGPEQQ